jgi:hypothetical protein
VGAAVISLLLGAAFWANFAGGHSAGRAEPGLAPDPRAGLSSLHSAARGSLSAALGEADPAYRVDASPGGFRAISPAQRLHISFGGSGVVLRSGPLQLGLSLRAAGYGKALRPLAAVAPRARADRVLYSRKGLTEWYANGPFGLEQGFGIEHAPGGAPAGPLTLSMALSGNAHASLAGGGSGITLGRAGGPALRYGGLVARDARGRTLPSWLELRGRQVLLRVDARGARYPLRIDPVFELKEQGKLTGSGESGAGQFGSSVALSSNGNTALIGASEDNGGVGAAWVFTRSGSTWTQQGEKLTAAGESGAGHLGASVALSGDGTTAIVGAPENGGGGAAWVFTRSGSAWTQEGELTGSGVEVARFGNSVALSRDGGTALIGGPETSRFAGAAWVFTRSGSTWTQQQELTEQELTGGEKGGGGFGYSVALSEDGGTALIGAIAYRLSGAAWVFTRSGSAWAQQGPPLTSGTPGPTGELGQPFGAFGSGVSLSSEGSTALVGGPGEGIFAGAAWVFKRTGGTWSQPGVKLTPNSGEETGNGYFGYGVALSSGGNTALIGAPEDSAKTGAAWMFRQEGSKWTQASPKLKGNGESGGGYFGFSAALSATGGTALIGGPEDSTKLGAAWPYLEPARATEEELTGRSKSPKAPNGGAKSKLGSPVITHARQSRNRWRERDQVAHISRAQALLFMAAANASSSPFTHTSRRGKYRIFHYNGLTGHEYSKRTKGGVGSRHNIIVVIPAGTTFSFTLNVQAAVSFTFTRNLSGRKLKGRCVGPTSGARAQPACTRAVTQGTLSLSGYAGPNTVPFEGLIPGSPKLAPGSYTLVIRATNAAGRSTPKRLRFQILG